MSTDIATASHAANPVGRVRRVPASFRDPSGFVFERDGGLFRQVQHEYRPHYDHLLESGLLAALVRDGLVAEHEEVGLDLAAAPGAYKVLRPRMLRCISYPYEWSFSQLKAAALLTLKVQAAAVEHGMVLKDASAYNVQFDGAAPVLIDSLSFEMYEKGTPWVGYRQFCQHFLGPLALMAHVDVRLGQLLRAHLDGVPLDLASLLLPRRTWFRPSTAMHIHAHARAQQRYAGAGCLERSMVPPRAHVSRTGLLGIISSLQRAVTNLRWRPEGTEWADYYTTLRYTDKAFAHKRELVGGWFDAIEPRPRRILDLGANTGVFSRSLADKGAWVMAVDVDHAAVEQNYRQCVEEQRSNVLPLVVDLTNPSPGIGWANEERPPFFARASPDLVLCLAMVHHLAIGNNVQLEQIAALLQRIAPRLIIEFVPKNDEQVQGLLASRPDVFPDYTQDAFETAFLRHFSVERRQPIAESERILYLMRQRPSAGLERG